MTNNAEQIPASLWEPLESGEKHSDKIEKPSLTFLQDGWRRLKQNKTAMLSMIVIVHSGTRRHIYPLFLEIQLSGTESDAVEHSAGSQSISAVG